MTTGAILESDADPEVFQLGVRQWPDGDDVVLWHPVTGRHVRLHHTTVAHLVRHPADPRLGPVRDRLDRYHLLRSSPPPPWPELVPCRSRLVLTLPDEAALWLPVPGYRGPGGHGYRTFRLSPDAHRVWTAINDARPLVDVAARAGVDLLTAQSLCALLTAPELQALQLRPEPPAHGIRVWSASWTYLGLQTAARPT